MKICWFVHAVASCWNNGNAHFLRGLGVALQKLGHDVLFYEPCHSWSETNLLKDNGAAALHGFRAEFPALRVEKYDPLAADFQCLTDGADLVIVHEWNQPKIVANLGQIRKGNGRFTLLFQDTHHRSATDPEAMCMFDLSGYDGVLAFGAAIAAIYRKQGWANRVWILHEAADTTTFHPRNEKEVCDLIWIGNWGDEERTAELREFLIGPACTLQLRTRVFGVRYPASAVAELAECGLSYDGWLPNHQVPAAFGKALFTVHVPRRAYAKSLSGIPTIRVFEALSCGIPLISAPWDDSESLFPEGCYLTVRNGSEMRTRMRELMADPDLRETLCRNGLAIIAARHTCRHRALQLLDIYSGLKSVYRREAA